MRNHDFISSILLFFVGLIIVLYAPGFGLGSPSVPGPGFMPFLTGVMICLFSAITFFQALFSQSAATEKIWAKIRFSKLIFTVMMLLVYTLLLQNFGFIICTFFLVLILIRYVGSQTWFTGVLGAILSSGLSYLLFETWLKAQLPKGIFGF